MSNDSLVLDLFALTVKSSGDLLTLDISSIISGTVRFELAPYDLSSEQGSPDLPYFLSSLVAAENVRDKKAPFYGYSYDSPSHGYEPSELNIIHIRISPFGGNYNV